MSITVEFITSILNGRTAEEWTDYAQKNFTIETLMSTLIGFPLLAQAYLDAERNRVNLDIANRQLHEEITRLKKQILVDNGLKDE